MTAANNGPDPYTQPAKEYVCKAAAQARMQGAQAAAEECQVCSFIDLAFEVACPEGFVAE